MIVIEHSPELMTCADWIIDLGPGAGRRPDRGAGDAGGGCAVGDVDG
jgi:excinuclease UvrABC ATPase subunit